MNTITREELAREHGVISLSSRDNLEVLNLIFVGNVDKRDFSSYRLKTGNMQEVKRELLILCALYVEYLKDNGFDSETYYTCDSQKSFDIYGIHIKVLLDAINPKFILYLHLFDQFVSGLLK